MEEIKQHQLDQMDQIMHDLLRRYKNIQSDIESLFPEGMTSLELSIIKAVNANPEIIIKEISEYLALPGSTLTSAIDRLEQKNLIRRVVSKRNKRSLGLELTKDGARINAIHENAEQQIWRRILAKFQTNDEREAFLKLLKVISAKSEEQQNQLQNEEQIK